MDETRRGEILESLDTVQRVLKWNRKMTHKEHAENFVYLPKTNAFGAGRQVDFTLTPHLLKPMEALDNTQIQEVYLMFASQMAKTLLMFIAWSHNAKNNSKTVVWMIPKKDMIQRYQKEKISDLVKASPSLSKIVEDTRIEEGRSKNKGGIIAHNGSTTYLIGSIADDDKKAVSAKIVIADEIDEFKDGLGSVTPAWERAKTFLMTGAKLLCASTKKSSNGAITKGFNLCEQKNFLTLKCPHCNELIEPTHTQFIIMSEKEFKEERCYTDDEFTDEVIAEEYIPYASSEAYYECNENGCKITNEEKNSQILDGEIDWLVKGNQINPKSVGFSANSFLSYFVPFEEIAKRWLNAKTELNPTERTEMLKKLFEGYFNDSFEEEAKERIRKNDILTISNGLDERIVPADTFKVYLTIDTQLTHFWWTITAWQYGSKCNLVDYGRADSFDELDTIRNQVLVSEHGEIMPINKVVIDRLGDKRRTALVDEWVRNIVLREGKEDYIYATEGVSGKTMTTIHTVMKHKTMKEFNIIKVNNLMAKDYAHSLITRSVEKVKAEAGDEKLEHALIYEDNMFFVNNKPVRLAEEKYNDGVNPIMTDYERMMSSEVKTFAIDKKTGKVDSEESWIKVNESIRNDYWDNFVQSVACWDMDSGYMAVKPKELSHREIRDMEHMIAQKKSVMPSNADHF